MYLHRPTVAPREAKPASPRRQRAEGRTACQCGYACIRCPMLSINPKMLPRLDELEEDLLARRERAQREGWRGEIEGLDLTLTFLRGKRAETQRMLRQGPPGSIELGMPTLPSRH